MSKDQKRFPCNSFSPSVRFVFSDGHRQGAVLLPCFRLLTADKQQCILLPFSRKNNIRSWGKKGNCLSKNNRPNCVFGSEPVATATLLLSIKLIIHTNNHFHRKKYPAILWCGMVVQHCIIHKLKSNLAMAFTELLHFHSKISFEVSPSTLKWCLCSPTIRAVPPKSLKC